MAKLGKALQTMARGRVGSIVYYVRKGEQVARSLSQSTTNPQTSAQMTTRVTWNNLVQFFKRSRFWMHWGAFEDKKKTWSDYNAFMSANAAKRDVAITKEQAAAGYGVVADYVVSKGSLPTVNITYADGKYTSDIYFGEDADFDSTATVGDLSVLLLENNNGLLAGDQISFIVYLQGGNANAPTMICRAYEMIIDENDSTLFTDIVGDFLTVDYEGANGALSMQFEGQGGATIIVSREVSGKLKVSSQTLVIDGVQQAFLDNFTSAAARQRAARSYGSDGQRNFLSAGYSNVSSEDGAIPLSILGVNGNTAGTSLVIVAGNDVTFDIQLSRPIAETLDNVTGQVVFNYQGQDNQAALTGATSLGNNIYRFHAGELPPGTVTRIRVTADGQNAIINFAAPASDDNQEGIGG